MSNGDSAIEFTVVPVAAVGGSYRVAPIAGRVLGARPEQRIVVYGKSGRVWWVQPVVTQPFTTIAANSTWNNTIHLGLEYAALLVDQRFSPPATMESLPERGGAVAAIAAVKGSGEFRLPKPAMLTFSGYEWEIRQVPSDRYGANDFDARNAWVDADGMLHLAVVRRDGMWTSAEVKLTRALGYGSYAFGVRDTSALDPAVALGMFTWDDLGEQYHRELDIEIGRWGGSQQQGRPVRCPTRICRGERVQISRANWSADSFVPVGTRSCVVHDDPGSRTIRHSCNSRGTTRLCLGSARARRRGRPHQSALFPHEEIRPRTRRCVAEAAGKRR
jgi:hypothetical protein